MVDVNGKIAVAITVAIILLSLGIALGLGQEVLKGFEDEYTGKYQTAVTNDSNANVDNNTAITINHPGISMSEVIYWSANASDNKNVLPAADYSTSCGAGGLSCTLTLNMDGDGGNTTFLAINYSYSYDTQNVPFNATREGQRGIDNVASFQDTIGLIVIASILIAIVLTAIAGLVGFGKFRFGS